jgi:hypothetical protein
MKNLETIEHKHPDKKTLKQMAAEEAADYLERGDDVTPIYIQAKRVADYCTEFASNLKERVVEEREAFSKQETIRIYGATVSVAEMGVRYDYSKCNDAEWTELNNQIKELEKQRKAREKFLQALSKPESKFDEESGEVYKIFPPRRTSTTSPKLEY